MPIEDPNADQHEPVVYVTNCESWIDSTAGEIGALGAGLDAADLDDEKLTAARERVEEQVNVAYDTIAGTLTEREYLKQGKYPPDDDEIESALETLHDSLQTVVSAAETIVDRLDAAGSVPVALLETDDSFGVYDNLRDFANNEVHTPFEYLSGLSEKALVSYREK